MGEATDAEADLLSNADLAIVGRVLDSSNATFVVEATQGSQYAWAIYKPEAGERPLWDFEPGLYKRERAAYLLSEHLGWGLVPTTIVRDDGPLGVGSLQWFIEAQVEEHFFTLIDSVHLHPELRRVAVFDYLSNNTDRKSGHLLRDAAGRIWAIDHGLCFAAEYKLRTVIWDFAGDPVAEDVLADLAPLADDVPASIAELLTGREVRALQRRASRLLESRTLPHDPTGRAWPWPLV